MLKSVMRINAHCCQGVLGACLALALVLGWSTPAEAGAVIGSWKVHDEAGRGWGLSLFEQPDPALPAGWRLRLSARAAGVAVDHARPLRVCDGLGGLWALTNRSQELVPAGETSLPAGSAQFDASGLVPRPSAVAPLRLEVPLRDGDSVAMTLGPEVVPALQSLPLTPAPGD